MVSGTMMRRCQYRLYLRMRALVALDLRLLATQSDFVDCRMLSVDRAHIRLLLGTASKLVGTFLEDHIRALVSFEVLLSRVLNEEVLLRLRSPGRSGMLLIRSPYRLGNGSLCSKSG
jgi:hypothetical protein